MTITPIELPEMHKTSYQPGRGKFAPEYQDLYWTLLGCFPNLESPDWILTGRVFTGGRCYPHPICESRPRCSLEKDY